jgi:hypothetical protein
MIMIESTSGSPLDASAQMRLHSRSVSAVGARLQVAGKLKKFLSLADFELAAKRHLPKEGLHNPRGSVS